jgi:small subunit ribosomal protein S18
MIKNPSHPKKGHLRQKECKFTKAGIEYIDYKNTDLLQRFMNDQGKILPRRVTGTSAKYQRQLAKAIKRARFMGMLPYVEENMR